MRGLEFLCPALLAVSTFAFGADAAKKPVNSVLLSGVKTLTLREDVKTTHRRVSAIPQLKCVGGNGKGLYEIDVMRCRNQGSDYDDENIQWTCTASLPPEFKLGSTEVICEGYDSPTDPYILKGSCGVEYRLFLTDKGEQKYGRGSGNLWRDFKRKGAVDWGSVLFWVCFVCVLGWIIYSAMMNRGRGLRADPGNNPWGWGGGGGGWGGGGNDPPPPYDWQPPRKPRMNVPTAGQEGWRPGFWTGALGGAAAGYMAGNRGQNQPRTRGWGGYDGNGGEGSSRWGSGGGSSSSSPTPSSSRHESTGFGSTNRR